MRVLGVIRLSRETDETTSPERQREGIQAWARAHGHEIVGWAEDLDISGSVSPWERPSLGQWLTADPPASFDVIAGTKIDRISRSLAHFVQMIDWATDHGRYVVAYMDSVDTSTETGSLVAKILAIFAEFERKTIAARAADSQRHARNQGRWHGGTPPYGYLPQPLPGGKGWGLALDPESSKRVSEIVRRIIDGESMNSICIDFNSKGIPTPSDHYRQSVGKPTLGRRWKTTALIPMLRSRTLLGEAVQGGQVVRGEDGLPVRRAEPIVSPDDWSRLQLALDKLSIKKTRTASTSPLLGIAFCGYCGEPMYSALAGNKKDSSVIYRYYRCRGKTALRNGCKADSLRAERLESLTEGLFLVKVGGLEVYEKRLIPGESHAAELGQVERALSELREDRAAGLYSGERGSAEYRDMYIRLERRRAALEELPNVPDRWEMVPTGRTFRELWADLETAEERRAFLLKVGVTVKAKSDEVVLEVPSDLQRRVEEHAATAPTSTS